MAVKSKSKKKKAYSIGPIISPGCGDETSGCYYCPLLPFSNDFKRHKKHYARDPNKVLKKAEDHRVHTRAVRERSGRVDVLFVGEAPGHDEDLEGIPFVGKSGQYLRQEARRILGIDDSRMAFSNVVSCRPPNNRDPNKTEVKSCKPKLIREINKRQPKVIVALGNHSLNVLTGRSGIRALQGNTLACARDDIPNVPIVACFHPAYVQRNAYEKPKFRNALKLVRKHLRGEVKKKRGLGTYKVVDDPDEVVKLLRRFRKNKRDVAFDTETGGLSPFQETYPPLLCLSFSDKEGVGYTIPLDHVDSPWALPKYIRRQMNARIEVLRQEIEHHEQRAEELKTAASRKRNQEKAFEKKKEVRRIRRQVIESVQDRYENGGKEARKKVKKALRQFFADDSVPKIAQNAKFDVQHIYRALGVKPFVHRDTMLTHLTIEDQRSTHGLKVLAVYHTGMDNYEKPLEDYISSNPEADPQNGGSYANIPGDVLFRYAAMDTDVTIRADRAIRSMKAYRNTEKFQRLAEWFFPRLSDTIADMEYRGAHLSVEKIQSLREKYLKQMQSDIDQIHALPEVKTHLADRIKYEGWKGESPTFNPLAGQAVAEVLYKYAGATPITLTDSGLDTIRRRMQRLEEDGQHPDFDDLWQQALEDEEWNVFSVDANVLHQHAQEGNEFAELVLDYRKHQKTVSTFLDPFFEKLDRSNCIHGSFLIHGTVGGRLSSAGPNLQNIPKDVRHVYDSRFKDGVVVEVDNSQIELRVASCWFGEPKMIDAYREGRDIHRQTAVVVSGCGTEDEFSRLKEEEQDRWRDIGKRMNFAVLYGATATRIQSTLHEYGVDRDIETCERILNTFFEAFSSLKKGMDRTLKHVRRKKYLMTETGRCRRFPEIDSENRGQREHTERMAINFPIQSLASEMTLLAMTLINERLKDEGYRSMVIMTVHDSVMIDAPISEALEVASIAKYTMENVLELSEDLLPGVDWSWLTVPIKSEVKIGRSWGTSEQLEPHEHTTKKLRKVVDEAERKKAA